VFETPERLPEDEVTVIVLEIGGKRIVHLGDLGHELSEVEVRELQGADCLLVPAGGPPTIEIDQIPALLDTLAPRLVIPVHYFIPGKIGLAIKPVDELVAKLTNWHVRRPGTSTIDFVDWAGLDRQCLILEPAR
jgi:L-ascorbate metabolism protein UlaG (beta-lactamase superfamily)